MRARNLLAQAGWRSGIDEASGATFYYNLETGQSQWEPPTQMQQSSYGQVAWHFAPTWGVHAQYTVRNGEEQILGRFDMIEEKSTVSRMQCVVQVAADGTATIASLGKRPTGLRAREGAPWYGLEADTTRQNVHVLKHGEQIALDIDSGESFGWQGTPYTAVYTCLVESTQSEGRGMEYESQQQQFEQQNQYGDFEPQGGYSSYPAGY